nr:MAG TPA: hypothetical protein [Caudoviricetes sp.]
MTSGLNFEFLWISTLVGVHGVHIKIFKVFSQNLFTIVFNESTMLLVRKTCNNCMVNGEVNVVE